MSKKDLLSEGFVKKGGLNDPPTGERPPPPEPYKPSEADKPLTGTEKLIRDLQVQLLDAQDNAHEKHIAHCKAVAERLMANARIKRLETLIAELKEKES